MFIFGQCGDNCKYNLFLKRKVGVTEHPRSLNPSKAIAMAICPIIVHAFVSSRIDYYNSLLYGVPNCHLHKLQRVQNAAARLLFEESKYCHVTPLLKSLHWLPVKYRIIFKVLLITFKAIHGLAPVSISELISIRDVSLSRYCLRSTNSLMLNYPALKSRKTLGDRSFFVAAPKLWNELSSDIRDLNSINKFQTAIKTYLFRQAFL